MVPSRKLLVWQANGGKRMSFLSCLRSCACWLLFSVFQISAFPWPVKWPQLLHRAAFHFSAIPPGPDAGSLRRRGGTFCLKAGKACRRGGRPGLKAGLTCRRSGKVGRVVGKACRTENSSRPNAGCTLLARLNLKTRIRTADFAVGTMEIIAENSFFAESC